MPGLLHMQIRIHIFTDLICNISPTTFCRFHLETLLSSYYFHISTHEVQAHTFYEERANKEIVKAFVVRDKIKQVNAISFDIKLCKYVIMHVNM